MMKERLYAELNNEQDDISWLNRLIATAVVVSVGVIVLETEITIRYEYSDWFDLAHVFFAALFTIEYAARVWVAGIDPQYRGLRGRIRYMMTPLALIDLIALLPFFFVFLADSFLLRIVRLLRIITIAKLGRHSEALRTITYVIWQRRYELIMAALVSFLVMLLAASALYLIEGEQNPDQFGSIPRAMWWSTVTLTSVGYGDVVPMSVLGKFFAACYIFGTLGLVGLPAAILAGAFMEIFAEQRRIRDERGQCTGTAEGKADGAGFSDSGDQRSP